MKSKKKSGGKDGGGHTIKKGSRMRGFVRFFHNVLAACASCFGRRAENGTEDDNEVYTGTFTSLPYLLVIDQTTFKQKCMV